jgi:hypothetical protein
MKIYPYILIDKDNMSKVEHYTKVEDLVDILASKKKLHHCIVLKDETRILTFPKFTREDPYRLKCYAIREVLKSVD